MARGPRPVKHPLVASTISIPRTARRTPRSFLLARVVVPLPFLDETLLVLGRELRPIDRQRQLVELAGERERHLVLLVVHRRAGVGTDVEGLVELHDDRDRVLHLLGADDLAVDLERPLPRLPDTTHAV